MPLLNCPTTSIIPYQTPGSSIVSTAQANNMKTPNHWLFLKRIGGGYPKIPETQKAIPCHAIVMELDVWPRWHLKAANYHLLYALRCFHGDIIGCTRLSYSLMSNHNTTQNNTVLHTTRNDRCMKYIRDLIFGRHHLPWPHRQAIQCLNCYGKTKHIEVETKWPPFWRRHFETDFLAWKLLYFDTLISLKFLLKRLTNSDPALLQMITRQPSSGPIWWYIHVSLDPKVFICCNEGRSATGGFNIIC